MLIAVVVFATLFAYFVIGILWAQKGRSQGPAAARRRGRYVVATGWGLIGVAVAVHGAFVGDGGQALAGALLAAGNVVWLWYLRRTART
jgi:hypothetical protein